MNLSRNNFAIPMIIALFAEIKSETNNNKHTHMEGIGKYIGALILLIGVLVLAIPAFTDSITDMCEKVALPNGCVHKSFYMFCIKFLFIFATGWYSEDSIRVYVRFCGQNMTKYCSRIR